MEIKSKILLSRPEYPELVKDSSEGWVKSVNPLTLSVSKAKTFKDCQAKYKFCYIEKLPRKDWDFHVFGKYLHDILERYYKKILDNDVRAPNVILSSCWKEAYAVWKPQLTKDQITEAKDICTLFLKYLTNMKNSFRVLAVEDAFFIDIDGKILLNGFIDRVQIDDDGVLHVADYKTTKNKKYLKNDYFQLLTYAFVMCLRDPSIKKVRTSYILLRHGFESIVKEFERDEIMKIESSFIDYAEKIHAEKLFRPNPTFLCNFCDYIDACEAGQKIAGSKHSSNHYGNDKW
jgi:putative RecB family exonuclease